MPLDKKCSYTGCPAAIPPHRKYCGRCRKSLALAKRGKVSEALLLQREHPAVR